MLFPGDTFLLPKPGQDISHLWIVLTHPIPPAADVILVNITTQRPHSDTTVIIQGGELPFVKRPSVVFYADARMVSATKIEEAIQYGLAVRRESFTEPVLRRIQKGLLDSPFSPQKVKRAFSLAQQQGLA